MQVQPSRLPRGGMVFSPRLTLLVKSRWLIFQCLASEGHPRNVYDLSALKTFYARPLCRASLTYPTASVVAMWARHRGQG
jgi:hypothetical protein